jgi:hypothetical protein
MPDVKHCPKQDAQVSEHSKIQAATPNLVKRRGLKEPSLTMIAIP